MGQCNSRITETVDEPAPSVSVVLASTPCLLVPSGEVFASGLPEGRSRFLPKLNEESHTERNLADGGSKPIRLVETLPGNESQAVYFIENI